MFELNVNTPQNEQVVLVNTTKGRGFTPEELSEQCVQKLISVSDTAPPAIRDQARAYQKHVETLVAFYMRQAIRSERPYNCV
jgi:hypothetical protein